MKLPVADHKASVGCSNNEADGRVAAAGSAGKNLSTRAHNIRRYAIDRCEALVVVGAHRAFTISNRL